MCKPYGRLHFCFRFHLLLVLCIFRSGFCWSLDYYVSPAGLDSNPGTAVKPWRTVSKAAASLQAGDTVFVEAGTYNERVEPQQSGIAGRPISYVASPEGSVIIDGRNIELRDDLAGIFDIYRRNFITVKGFRIVNAGPYRDNAGIMVNESEDIAIKNCITSNTLSSGIGVWASRRVVIVGCRVDTAGGGGYQESITVAGTDTFEVLDCRVSDCRKEGICLKDGSSRGRVTGNEVQGAHGVGIYVDAWDKYTQDIEIYGNRTHDNDGNGIALASEMGGLLENIRIHDNLSYHNRHIGIHISTNGDSVNHPMRGISVVNNTCALNGWTDWGGGIAHDNPGAMTVLIRNNICSVNRYFQLVVVPQIPRGSAVVDHNLIDGFGGTEGEITGDGAVMADPLFKDSAAGDFHLQARSPAVNAGYAEGAAPLDFDGRPRQGTKNPRPEGGPLPCSIGAYEM